MGAPAAEQLHPPDQPVIVVATCDGWPSAQERDQPLADALARRGCVPARAVWSDGSVDWGRYAACVVRSTWDWQYDPDGFRAWMGRMAGATRLFNELATMLWGLDKRYLHALAAAGVPVVPTIVVQPDERAEIPRRALEQGWRRVVVKPSLGATAYRTEMVDVTGADPHSWLRQNADFDGVALVQPFLESIQTGGEVSLIYIDGRFTHVVSKKPAAGDFRVQREFGGSAVLADPDGDFRRLGDAAAAAIPQLPLYARIDVVRDNEGRPCIMECEVIEPELYFDLFPPAADALAAALVGRVRGGPCEQFDT